MTELETLIYEALQKFPSEDIRELVAEKTGLTVEEVSQKMNEAAKAESEDFPAADFTKIEVNSNIEIKSYVSDLNNDGEYDTEADKELAKKALEKDVDKNKDNKITYYIAEISYRADIYNTKVADLSFEEKTAKIGTRIEDVIPDTHNAYASYGCTSLEGIYEYTTLELDNSLEYYSDNDYYVCGLHDRFSSVCQSVLLADGAVIVIQQKH